MRPKTPRRGTTILEAALVLPVCLTLVFGLCEYGRFVMIRQLLDNAACVGAHTAVVSTSTLTTQDIQNIVTNSMAGQTLQGMTIQVYQANPTTGANIGLWTNAGLGDRIAVQINGNYIPIVPKISLLPNPLPMSATSISYSEAN